MQLGSDHRIAQPDVHAAHVPPIVLEVTRHTTHPAPEISDPTISGGAATATGSQPGHAVPPIDRDSIYHYNSSSGMIAARAGLLSE
jgi:hypothetical protein